MAKASLNKPLTFRTSAFLLTTACLVVAAVELQALKAKEPSAKPANQWNGAECIRCHADQNSIKRMWEKEDGANFLFNPDGTFKNSSGLTANFQHPGRAEIEKALQTWNAAPPVKTKKARAVK